MLYQDVTTFYQDVTMLYQDVTTFYQDVTMLQDLVGHIEYQSRTEGVAGVGQGAARHIDYLGRVWNWLHRSPHKF